MSARLQPVLKPGGRLHAMPETFAAQGFTLQVISEPVPVPAAREIFPEDFGGLSTSPGFLFFVLRAG